jgi:ribosomal protein S18 acetylase RimI-like enzyme
MYLISEDGTAYPLAEVMKYNNPSMDFDPATGEALGPAAPPAASSEAEMRAQAALEPERLRAQDTFGDTTMRMAQPYIDSAIDLAANAGRRPTYFSDPLLGGVERVGQYVGDMGLAGLSGLGALTYGGAGLMGEVFGGSPSDERMLARDLSAGIDVAGVGPEARAFGLLSDAVRAERGGVGSMTRGFLADESGAVPLTFGKITNQKIGETSLQYRIGDDGVAEILSVRTPNAKRGQGSARKAVQELLNSLDEAGVRETRLIASPLDKKTSARGLASFYESLGFSPTGERANLLGDPWMARRFSSSDPATERGAQIIDMLTSGRANEITDQMLDMGDPVLNANLNQYLYRNYDLPMDEASRMERAGQMSMDTEAYKGMPTYTGGNTYTYTSRGKTLAAEAPEREILAIDAPKAYYLPEKVAGFSSDNPEVANRFQSLFDRGAVYPLRVDTRGMTPIDMRGEYAGAAQFDRYGDRGSAEREAFRAAIADQNNNGVMLLNTADEGTVYIPRNPQQHRSQFARFDPRLSHLRNLSAGVAPFGLLALQPNEEQY